MSVTSNRRLVGERYSLLTANVRETANWEIGVPGVHFKSERLRRVQIALPLVEDI